MVGGREVTENSDLSEIFNSYFNSAATELRSRLPDINLNAISLIPSSPVSFFLHPTTHVECAKIITNLKNCKSSIDVLPVKLHNGKDAGFNVSCADRVSGSFIRKPEQLPRNWRCPFLSVQSGRSEVFHGETRARCLDRS